MPTLQQDADELVVIASRIRGSAKTAASLARERLEADAAKIEAIAQGLTARVDGPARGQEP